MKFLIPFTNVSKIKAFYLIFSFRLKILLMHGRNLCCSYTFLLFSFQIAYQRNKGNLFQSTVKGKRVLEVNLESIILYLVWILGVFFLLFLAFKFPALRHACFYLLIIFFSEAWRGIMPLVKGRRFSTEQFPKLY